MAGRRRKAPLGAHVPGRFRRDTTTFSRDGRQLAIGFELGISGTVGTVWILNPATGALERAVRPIGQPSALAFAPNGVLVTGTWAGIIQRWSSQQLKELGRPVLAMPAPVSSISFDRRGDKFATGGGSGGFVKLWDASTMQEIGSPFPGVAGPWANAAFTPDGSKLVTLYEDGHGSVWPSSPAAWRGARARSRGGRCPVRSGRGS